jgi:DnaK suppressor protein
MATSKTPPASTEKAAPKTVKTTKAATTKAATASAVKAPNKIPTATLSASDVVPTLEQIQAMPESDYMCSAQLHYFQSVLEKMRTEIFINTDSTSENLRDNVVVPDPVDRATIEEEHAIELRTRDRERKLLKKIAQALEAIERGEYGWCEETGDAIGLRRLLARPTATLSLEAQQRRELKQKMFGD